METRVKKFKDYRDQIKKEFLIDKKINSPTYEISNIENKLANLKNFEIKRSTFTFSEINLIDNSSNDIVMFLNKINYISDEDINKLIKLTNDKNINIISSLDSFINLFLNNDQAYTNFSEFRSILNNEIKTKDQLRVKLFENKNNIDQIIFRIRQIDENNKQETKSYTIVLDKYKENKKWKIMIIFLSALLFIFFIIILVFLILYN